MPEPQFYLLTSQILPKNFHILCFDDAAGSPLTDRIREDFGYRLHPIGIDLTVAGPLEIPERTRFAGIIWGNGRNFDPAKPRFWGIVGEIRSKGSDTVNVYGTDGLLIGEWETSQDNCPPVLPPEAFGLRRTPWWQEELPWIS